MVIHGFRPERCMYHRKRGIVAHFHEDENGDLLSCLRRNARLPWQGERVAARFHVLHPPIPSPHGVDPGP